MLRVSFSPVPEHVVADCWNRGFPTPPCHQATVVIIVMLYLFQKDFVFGNFLEADYHYTTIFGQSHSLRRFVEYQEAFVEYQEAFVEYQEAFVEYQEALVEYQEAFVEYKEAQILFLQ